MMKLKLIGLVALLAIFSGCIRMPVTPESVRAAAETKSYFYAKESIVVNRSVSAIGKTFKKNADKCLKDLRVVYRSEVMAPTGMGNMVSHQAHAAITNIDYNYDVIQNKDRVEFYVRNKMSGDVVNLAKEPEDGYFIMIVDVTPISKSKSNVDISYANPRKILLATVKDWANGKGDGCPDLDEDY